MTLSFAASDFEALVFDVGGVIVGHDNEAMYRQLASRCAPATAPLDVKSLIGRTKWSLGAVPISRLHGQLQAELGYGGDWPQFLEDWSCHFVIDASMLGFVAQLAERRRVILFSNTNEEHARHTSARMGALDGVERYLSCELGLAKPAPEAFLKVAELAGIEPSRSLMIDDAAENVSGARAAGFQALLFQGEAQLTKAFQQISGAIWSAAEAER